METQLERIQRMDFWTSDIEIEPLSGGITNHNFRVRSRHHSYFVRTGKDIPEHGIMRFNEYAASRAAYQAGISPEVLYTGEGIMVLQYIEGETLNAESIRKPDILRKTIDLIRRCHQRIPEYLTGPALTFWVFQVLRNYQHILQKNHSPWRSQLATLHTIATQLEQDTGEITLAFGHNDLLPANFMDDGKRLWLIDWDYAGFNTPLFDLAGLATNCEMTGQQQRLMLSDYYQAEPEPGLLKKYSAMKCASLMRESLWSMVSETHSDIDFDYPAYTRHNLSLFERAWQSHQEIQL